ncbi:AAA domain-containing protein [Pseudomonas sp. SJZ103]|uniref:ATP-binding domain-containing protein n=1 Tax=unclassified Pseudomonas TaxID=196821 RepID=UPI0011A8B791|nr:MULTISPECIES: ATP-binding domain-containing protein [unclassified Pseudomonas]TWC65486.1 AAA domain-containing protein [Pseudomonas sp. SJZ103]TWC82352.1 AAA domain-containing protein [Pseudomonas sp. SJZ094]
MSNTWWVDEDELLDEQLEVLGEDLFKDLILTGPPGSGKTNLLLLRANHLILASPDSEFYIICFTSLLQKFVRTGAGLYSFPENRVITQRKLLEQLLGDHACLPRRKAGETYPERDAVLKSAIRELMESGAGRDTYPVLFIDEAQDYSEEDLQIFKYFAKNLCCAADLRQGIYNSGSTGTTWLQTHRWGSSITLQFHYRVAPAILEVADKIMAGKFDHKSMLGTHQYKGDPGDVEVVPGFELPDQIEELIPRVLKQLAVYPNQIIGILVPNHVQLKQVVEQLLTSADLAGVVTNAMDRDFDPTFSVWVSTVHSSKGLEFRCTHVVAADKFADFQEHERRVAFMAVTRAKTALTIYHEKPLHPFFASALAKQNEEKISVKKIFGKKS